MAGERINRFLGLLDETGKFSKGQAYYVGDAFQKPFRCGNCFHFQNGKCRLVSEEGNPTPGVISPEGACSLYNARAPRIHALQTLWGREKFDGVAPEVARATAFTLTYTALDEPMPEDLRRKTLIPPETMEKFIPGR